MTTLAHGRAPSIDAPRLAAMLSLLTLFALFESWNVRQLTWLWGALIESVDAPYVIGVMVLCAPALLFGVAGGWLVAERLRERSGWSAVFLVAWLGASAHMSHDHWASFSMGTSIEDLMGQVIYRFPLAIGAAAGYGFGCWVREPVDTQQRPAKVPFGRLAVAGIVLALLEACVFPWISGALMPQGLDLAHTGALVLSSGVRLGCYVAVGWALRRSGWLERKDAAALAIVASTSMALRCQAMDPSSSELAIWSASYGLATLIGFATGYHLRFGRTST